MRKMALYGTLTVALVTLANVLHGVSHAGHHVPLAPWQWVYVVFVVFLAPIVAAILLWTRYLRIGAWLLVASMAGAFVFGLMYHFLIPGPDNVFTSHYGAWRVPFQVSGALVLLASGIGCVVAIRLFTSRSWIDGPGLTPWSPEPQRGSGRRNA